MKTDGRSQSDRPFLQRELAPTLALGTHDHTRLGLRLVPPVGRSGLPCDTCFSGSVEILVLRAVGVMLAPALMVILADKVLHFEEPIKGVETT